MGVIAQERALYESVWALPSYGDHSPGEERAPMFLDIAKPAVAASILDAGCGSGKGGLALRRAGHVNVTLCDMTREGLVDEAAALPFRESCLWQIDGRQVGWHDYVFCCDVLEHIPTEYTMLTIARLLSVAREGLFLSIALVPDQFGVWVGQPLHQTVREFTWWRDRLRDLGRLVDARDMLTSGVFYVRNT